MASRSALRTLMAGAAVASLSTAAVADGWNNLIIFGGRDYDSGQYVSYEAVFAEEDDEFGDGRLRATGRTADGGYGLVASQRVAAALGFVNPNPSQPQSHEDLPTPSDGWNYSAIFYNSEDILQSIVGTTDTGTITLGDGVQDPVTLQGRSRPGLLNDPDRADGAWGALVMVGSAQRDLRRTADIEANLDGGADIYGSRIQLDAIARDAEATGAATNIATGVRALTDAGAGLVLVSTAYDTGVTPEVGGDNVLLIEAEELLLERETEAQTAENAALTAEALQANADASALLAQNQRDTIAAQFTTANNDPGADADDVADLAAQLAAADANLANANTLAATREDQATTARADADDVALTPYEIALRPQLDAAIADPSVGGAGCFGCRAGSGIARADVEDRGCPLRHRRRIAGTAEQGDGYAAAGWRILFRRRGGEIRHQTGLCRRCRGRVPEDHDPRRQRQPRL